MLQVFISTLSLVTGHLALGMPQESCRAKVGMLHPPHNGLLDDYRNIVVPPGEKVGREWSKGKGKKDKQMST